MTSNLGSENFRKLTSPLGFLAQQVSASQVQGEILREFERRFPPEFRNRIDEVVLFTPLSHDEVGAIARIYLNQISARLSAQGKILEVRSEAFDRLVHDGYSLAYGARFLKRVIDDQVKLPISARWHEGSLFRVAVTGDHISVEALGTPTIALAPESELVGT
jgi:ATP-dependent Clp protease ATP-binding subunit ClpA